jgi:uncharacterized damage-inducible protein DinB
MSSGPLSSRCRSMGTVIGRDDLIKHVVNVQARTYEAFERLRDEHLEWRPAPGEFSVAELALHIVAARRMNLLAIETGAPRYPGHEPTPGLTADRLRELCLRSGKKTVAVLARADLERTIGNLAGDPFPAWKRVLGGLVEHEVHHRSQLCSYLAALGTEPPALFGLRVEALPR